MTRAGGARDSIGRSIVLGLAAWGIMACVVVAILAARASSAHAVRAPLPPLMTELSATQQAQWSSFPDYHDVVPVVVYHSVGGRPSYLTTSRKLFALQMHALKAGGFHPLTISQYASYVEHGPAGLPSRPILLTFDDGRLDAYRVADAILKMYGFHATELAVPQWVTAYPHFSLSWAELRQMAASGIWDVEEHFGYGHEDVPVDKAGDTDGAFGHLRYIRTQPGRPGHLETLAQFKAGIARNMEWGEGQMQRMIPGYRPLAMAIPESDFGQNGTNNPGIPPFVIRWLDRHYPVVMGGDYLNRTPRPVYKIPGRFSPKLTFRMSMGPAETVTALRCRLIDFVQHVPIWQEYSCLHQAVPTQPIFHENPLFIPPAPQPAESRVPGAGPGDGGGTGETDNGP
jgi:hypothetical protein